MNIKRMLTLMLILILCLCFSVGCSKIKTFTDNSTNQQAQNSQEETESAPIKIPSAEDPNTKKVVPKSTPETDYIDIIRSSSFYDYPYMTIGEGFDNYFGETDWYEFYDDNGNHLIEVAGIGYEYNNYVYMRAQFILYSDGEFEMCAFWIDDELQDMNELYDFIDFVFTQ